MQILLSRTQTGPGRAVKHEQEEISPNHVQRINLISVQYNGGVLSIVREQLPPVSPMASASQQDFAVCFVVGVTQGEKITDFFEE